MSTSFVEIKSHSPCWNKAFCIWEPWMEHISLMPCISGRQLKLSIGFYIQSPPLASWWGGWRGGPMKEIHEQWGRSCSHFGFVVLEELGLLPFLTPGLKMAKSQRDLGSCGDFCHPFPDKHRDKNLLSPRLELSSQILLLGWRKAWIRDYALGTQKEANEETQYPWSFMLPTELLIFLTRNRHVVCRWPPTQPHVMHTAGMRSMPAWGGARLVREISIM